MATAKTNITLGIAGPGKIETTNVKDLLGDYLGLGPEDAAGYPTWPATTDDIALVVPCTDKQLTEAVRTMLEWSAWADITYTAVTDGSIPKNDPVLADAEEVLSAKNVGMGVIDHLTQARERGDDVALIVSWGESGDDPTEVLIDLATARKIPVLAIDQGLDVLQFPEDQPEPEPEPDAERPRRGRRRDTEPEAAEAEPEAEPEPTTRRGRARKAAAEPSEPPVTADEQDLEAQVAHAQKKPDKPDPDEDVVLHALMAGRDLVDSLDAAAAARGLDESPMPSRLGRLFRTALEAYTTVPKKSAGGRPRRDGSPAQPRTPGDRAIKEIFDPDTGNWEPAGRGRIPKDAKTRTVDPKTGEVLTTS